MRRLTTEEFIQRAREVHGNKYDYSKSQYVNAKTKINIICPKHGEFLQSADCHLNRGHGCPKCKAEKSSMKNRKSIKDFVIEARNKHNNFYTYNKAEYINNKIPLIITCPIHGDFSQSPDNHLQGKGCPECAKLKIRENQLISQEQFLSKLKEWHPDYDFSITCYNGMKNHIQFICPIHGIQTVTAANAYYKGAGCKLCAQETRGEQNRLSKEEFISRSKQIHGDKYDYDKVNYQGYYIPVTIVCPVHGEFQQKPANHLRGSGCQKCNQSHGEAFVEHYLQTEKIKYIQQHYISVPTDIKSTGKIYVDFYIPDLNTIIEYNGIQHYVPIEHFGGKLAFNSQKKRDDYLRRYCLKNKIRLIELPYNIEFSILQDYLDTYLLSTEQPPAVIPIDYFYQLISKSK